MQEAARVNSIEDALAQCGITETTIAAAERRALDRLGYLVLPGVIDDDWLARLRAAVEAALRLNQRDGQHVHLAWSDSAFDGVYQSPKVLAAVYHILQRPFQAFLVTARAPTPGQGLQGLHQDWRPRTPAEPFSVVTALWLLDDFTPHNGATRIIPGSHRVSKPLPKPMQQPESCHPEQKLILAKAGSVLVFNGHLWHSGTRNETNGPRRVLQGQFRARDFIPPTETPAALPERFPAAVRYLLGDVGNDENGGGEECR